MPPSADGSPVTIAKYRGWDLEDLLNFLENKNFYSSTPAFFPYRNEGEISAGQIRWAAERSCRLPVKEGSGSSLRGCGKGGMTIKMKESAYKHYEELPLFLNAATVAKALGVSPSSGYELMHEPGFPVLRIGSRIVVPKEQFIKWVDEHTGGGK